MIDASEQGKGHGRAALGLLLDELRADLSVRRVGISYTPDNHVAQALYAGLGFKETSIDEATGEMEAVLERIRLEVAPSPYAGRPGPSPPGESPQVGEE